MSPEVQYVPFSEEDTGLLKEILHKRRKLFFQVFPIVIVMAILASFRISRRDRYSGRITRWEQTEESRLISATGMILLNMSFLLTPITVCGTLIYRKRILSLKKDIREGQKWIRPYQVTMKQYFPHTGQYFVGTNNPAYLHHEVDEQAYQQLSVGQTFFVYYARHSGYVFNKKGSYTLM